MNNQIYKVFLNLTLMGDKSIITSRTGGKWIYTFFVILRDGKLGAGGGCYLIKVHDITVKKVSMNYCIYGTHNPK